MGDFFKMLTAISGLAILMLLPHWVWGCEMSDTNFRCYLLAVLIMIAYRVR